MAILRFFNFLGLFCFFQCKFNNESRDWEFVIILWHPYDTPNVLRKWILQKSLPFQMLIFSPFHADWPFSVSMGPFQYHRSFLGFFQGWCSHYGLICLFSGPVCYFQIRYGLFWADIPFSGRLDSFCSHETVHQRAKIFLHSYGS